MRGERSVSGDTYLHQCQTPKLKRMGPRCANTIISPFLAIFGHMATRCILGGRNGVPNINIWARCRRILHAN